MVAMIKLCLVLFYLRTLHAGGGHKKEDEGKIGKYDKLYNQMYNNSFIHVDEGNNIIYIFGQCVAMGDNKMAVSNFDFNTNKSSGSARIFDFVGEKKKMNKTWRVEVPKKVEENTKWEHKDFGKSISFNERYVVIATKFMNKKKEHIERVDVYDMFGDNYGVLVPPDGQADDNFGNEVGINENNDIIVGACDHTNDTGAAYLFRYNKEWKSEKLQPNDLEDGDQFGFSVAITNKFIAIGAYISGSVYIYEKINDEWEVQHWEKLKSLEYRGMFGYSLSITDQGRMVVGAYNESSGMGNAYLYALDDNKKWSLKLKLNRNGTHEGHFGVSVAMHADTIAVAASRCNEEAEKWSGCVYTYRISDIINNKFELEGPRIDFIANDTNTADEFGISVSTYGGWVVVAKYNARLPFYCQSLRDCDEDTYTVEIATLIAIALVVIFILLCKK